MGKIIDEAIDWMADKVQSVTGEKERREWVQKIKNAYIGFKDAVEKRIDIINENIVKFNLKIKIVNDFRQEKVEKKIIVLSDFLKKFGTVKEIGEYSDEQIKDNLVLPERCFEEKENYIKEIDWSKDDVFFDTFFYSPIGMKIKTRKQNLSMLEKYNELVMEAEHTLKRLDIENEKVKQNTIITEIYLFCIEFIVDYVQRIIIPELEVVEAFFQAIKIKNEIIADHQLIDIQFSNDLELLRDTQYEKHYFFVKNAFMFYVIACKIYNTPVLTKLMKNDVNENDINMLEKNKAILLEQKEAVESNLMFKRSE